MRMRMAALASTALITTLVLAGCGQNNDPGGMPGMDHGSSSSSPSSSEASGDFNAADEMFVTMMIPHHQQAIEMADIVLAKDGLDPAVAELAQQIKDAQGPEMERMLGWLDDWGVEYEPDDMGGMDHGSMDDSGDGMMSEEDMATLEEADATQASRIFLEQMIVHHDGAVDMARTALEDGQNQDVLDLAQQVIDDQTAEISTMQDLLNEL